MDPPFDVIVADVVGPVMKQSSTLYLPGCYCHFDGKLSILAVDFKTVLFVHTC